MNFTPKINLAIFVLLTFALALAPVQASYLPSKSFDKTGDDAFYNTGNFGIGTTAPTTKLEVAGTIYSTTGGFKLPDATIIDGADDLGKWLSAGSDIYFSTGNVGIGTTTPQGLLDIRGSLCLNGGADCRTTWPVAEIGGSGTANYLPKFSDSDTLANSAIFETGGNIGIGTTVPTQKLEVTGLVRVGRYTTASLPTCDADALGSFGFDTDEDKPYICTAFSGGTWKPLDSDYDSDGITDAIDTDDNDSEDATATAGDTLSGKTFYAGGASVTGSMSSQSISNSTVSQSTGYYNAFNLATVDTDLATDNIKSGVTIYGVAGNSNVVNTSSGTIDSTARIRSGYTAWSDGTSYAGALANCGAGGSSCYANGGKWYASEAGESTTSTQTNVYVDGTARYITTDLCNSDNERRCYVTDTGWWYSTGGNIDSTARIRSGYSAFSDGTKYSGSLANCGAGGTACYASGGKWYASECANSTTGTKTNCYVDGTAKYVDSNACAANSNTGYCYMNTATLSAKDTTLTAANIKSGANIFGVVGTASPGFANRWVSRSVNANTACAAYCGPVHAQNTDKCVVGDATITNAETCTVTSIYYKWLCAC